MIFPPPIGKFLGKNYKKRFFKKGLQKMMYLEDC